MVYFTKMHGIGNDYIYINAMKYHIKNKALFTKIVCDRHFGIGADGVIFIEKSNVCDLKMQIFNPDGSEAEMCGNGIRCVGKFAYEKDLIKKDSMTVETLAGRKILKLEIKNGYVISVTVNMGKPVLDLEKISLYSDCNPFCIDIEGHKVELNCVSMGNPHAVVFVKNVDNLEIEKYGKRIENDSHFPNKTNVEFVEIVDKSTIKVRTYERGVGETLACGTGACASAIMAYKRNFTNPNVDVILKGGVLNISFNVEEDNIYMTGPATSIYEGCISYKN